MFNRNKFRAQVMLAGKTFKEVAEYLEINEATLYRKVQDDGRFTRQEIVKLIKFLSIDDPESIFFADELA